MLRLLSYSGPQEAETPPVGLAPTAVASDLTCALTTPQTRSDSFGLRTPIAPSLKGMNSHQVANNNNSFREEPAFTGFRESNPGPCGLTGRSNRKLHHPEYLFGLAHSI